MAIDFDDALDAAEPELSAGMNITPLIDVLLVLLVMIIITIPIRLHSVNMELPGAVPPQVRSEPLIVQIEVGPTNQLLWNAEPLADRAALAARLQAAAQQGEQPEIHIRSHPQAKYDTLAAVLSAAQRAGLHKIGVVGLEAYSR